MLKPIQLTEIELLNRLKKRKSSGSKESHPNIKQPF